MLSTCWIVAVSVLVGLVGITHVLDGQDLKDTIKVQRVVRNQRVVAAVARFLGPVELLVAVVSLVLLLGFPARRWMAGVAMSLLLAGMFLYSAILARLNRVGRCGCGIGEGLDRIALVVRNGLLALASTAATVALHRGAFALGSVDPIGWAATTGLASGVWVMPALWDAIRGPSGSAQIVGPVRPPRRREV